MFEGLFSDAQHLSHAYVIEGTAEQVLEPLCLHIQNVLGVSTVANPNVSIKQLDRLGIDDVRTLAELQQKTSLGKEGYKIFIVSFETATVEAQNAMLKILEEPTAGTIWFVITRRAQALLPTVLSRVQVVNIDDTLHEYQELARDFLKASYADREKILKQFAGDSKKSIPADRSGIAQLTKEVMSLLVEHKDTSADWSAIYRELEQLARYATDRSSSVKHIGDYMAIRVPQVHP